MKLPTGTKIGKYGFRSGGGSNHVRYDHKQRPTKIEVVCPKCSGYAVAKEPLHAQGCFVVGDLCSSWEIPSFNVACTQCNYRAVNVGYHQLTEPFHQIAHNGTVL